MAEQDPHRAALPQRLDDHVVLAAFQRGDAGLADLQFDEMGLTLVEAEDIKHAARSFCLDAPPAPEQMRAEMVLPQQLLGPESHGRMSRSNWAALASSFPAALCRPMTSDRYFATRRISSMVGCRSTVLVTAG